MGLVEEEYELGQFHVADLGESRIKLGHEPQQEGRIKLRLKHQFVGREDVHYALGPLALEEVVDVEGRLAEELVGALVLEGKKRSLDGSDAGCGDVAVGGSELGGVLRHIVEHGPEVLEVYEEKAPLVSDAEDDVEDSGLGLVELHKTGEKVRAHLGDGRPHGVALLAEYVEKAHGAALELGILDTEFGHPLLDEAGQASGLADAGEVALHVGHEAGYSYLAECLRKDLEGDGLAGAGRAGDESVAVGHFTADGNRPVVAVGYVEPSFFVVHTILFQLFCFSPTDKVERCEGNREGRASDRKVP